MYNNQNEFIVLSCFSLNVRIYGDSNHPIEPHVKNYINLLYKFISSFVYGTMLYTIKFISTSILFRIQRNLGLFQRFDAEIMCIQSI